MRRHERIHLAVVTSILALSLALVVQAETIYVDANATGLNDGSSWIDAYRHLQDALTDANTAAKPVEVRMAQGTYTPDQGEGVKAGGTDATFRMLNGVTIKGGFAGLGAPDPNAWDPSLYKTLLWGDLAGNDDVMDIRTAYDNSLHVVTASGTDATAVLEGVTIGHGVCYIRLIRFTDCGNGIYNQGGSPTIRSCTFSGNLTTAYGSAMFNSDGAAPRLEGCTFEKNYGVVAVYDRASTTVLIKCRFIENNGAGIRGESSRIECNDCSFIKNRSAALTLDNYSETTVTRCTFTGNGSYAVIAPLLTCTDCSFIGNGDGKSGPGAAVATTGTFVRCSFRDNVGSNCGAIYSSDMLTLRDCTFIHNRALSFGAVALNKGDIERCLFAGNRAVFEIGALYIDGPCKLTNCTIAGNRSGKMGAVFHIGSEVEQTLTNCIIYGNECLDPKYEEFTWSRRTTTSYSCVTPPFPELGVEPVGCFYGDPCFVDPGYWDPNGTPADVNDDFWVEGDYHLKSQGGHWDPNSKDWVTDSVTSPGVDGGDPNSPVGDELSPNGGRINMGFYGGTAEASKSWPPDSLLVQSKRYLSRR